jgi:hypothetical protein
MVVGARLNLAELREVGIAEEDIKDSDKDGNFLIIGEGYYLAVKHVWAKVFGAVHADPLTGNRAMLDAYISDNKWDWSLLLTPSYDMLETSPLALHFAGEPGAPGLAGTSWQVVLHFVQGAPVLDFSRPSGPRESGVGIEKAQSAGWCWPAAPVSVRPLGVTHGDPLD